jgi:hypothetical protein
MGAEPRRRMSRGELRVRPWRGWSMVESRRGRGLLVLPPLSIFQILRHGYFSKILVQVDVTCG